MNVKRRAAGIATIDRGVDLKEIIIRTSTNFATTSRDDAAGDCATKTEGIAHGKHPVADTQLVAVTESHIRHGLVSFDFNEREIGLGIATDEGRFHFSAVVLYNGDFLTALYDVIVGHGITISGDEKAGALRHGLARQRLAVFTLGLELFEEFFKGAAGRERQIGLVFG